MAKPTAKNLREGSVIWDDDLDCNSWWVLRKGKWVQQSDPSGVSEIRPGRFSLGAHTWVKGGDGRWSLYDARGVRLRGAERVPHTSDKEDAPVFDESVESSLE